MVHPPEGSGPPPEPSFIMKLHFVDGHEEVFEFSPEPMPALAEVEDFRGRLARAMKEGILRLVVDDSDMLVFTSALAYIETTPGTPAPGTFPWTFHRL